VALLTRGVGRYLAAKRWMISLARMQRPLRHPQPHNQRPRKPIIFQA
jgi:hypothetical protein